MADEPSPVEPEGDWCIVNNEGYVHRLPKTMIFLGREECDIEVQSETVDKRHAVVTFDHYLRRFKIKDLSTTNGTHVNENRIPEQEYVTLEQHDTVRLGSVMYRMERFQEPGTRLESDRVFSPDSGLLPSWASTQEESPQMAECQGCIVEQHIEHTCGESIPESETVHHDLDRSYSHDSIATFGLGCNTWPRKRHKNKKHVAALFDMDKETTTGVDVLVDHPYSQGPVGSGASMEPLTDHPSSRVSRGTGAPMNHLPPELATVKKGTPLYGQPEWWGDDDTTQSNDLTDSEKLRSNGVMMDMPHPEHPPGQELPSTELRNNVATELRNNVSNNSCDTNIKLDRDLVPSAVPKPHQDRDTVPNTVPKEEVIPSEMPSPPEGNASMAFTVDFGDAAGDVSGKRLSDFVPSKMRKSFRERLEKSAEKTAAKAAKDKEAHNSSQSSKSSDRAVSEGRDISPTRQRKIDELWNSTGKSSESPANKRIRMLGRAKSSDHDEEKSDSTASKGSRSVKRRPPVSTSVTKPKSVIRARKVPGQEVAPTQVTDSASYLIDKMFQDSKSSPSKDTHNTEYALYKEAKQYNTDQSRKSSSFEESETRVSKPVVKDVPTSVRKSSEDRAKEEEDKVSEAGTYTVEQEKDDAAEREARENIDAVFGVDQISDIENLTDDLKQEGQPDKEKELALNLRNLDDELQELDRLEELRALRPSGDSLDVELGSSVDREEDDEDNPGSSVPSDAPMWVTQWASLTNQKPRTKSGDMELSSPGSSVSDDRIDGRSSSKAQNGLSRKRPGTGRKLPTIPPKTMSPEEGENSVKESPRDGKGDGTANMSQGRAVKISSHVTAKYQDTDSESISLTKYESSADSVTGDSTNRSGRHHGSNGSVASLDTEVLLKDTATVMAAMEARVGTKPGTNDHVQQNGHAKYSRDLNESAGSDTDSVVALVNGDEDFVKPSFYKSPREALGRGKLKLSESLPSKPVVHTSSSGAKSYTKPTSSSSARRRSGEEKENVSVVSDSLSSVNGGSPRSSASTDISDPGQFTRQGSKGKGSMSMTRPNRAFQLRRARADGDEVLDTSRSVSIASTGFSTPRAGSMSNISKSQSMSRSQKPRRPLSGKLSDRNQESARSEVSLGAQIVQKSRDNTRTGSQPVNFTRTDGGRHSLRMPRSLSIPQQSPSTPSTASSTSRSRKSDITNTSSQLRHSSSLRVTGVAARERSSSSSQPHSNSSSPKSAERNAWKRRKEYDPRRAVAEAKTRVKESAKKRDMNVFGQRVTRSASFTNTRDLNLKLSAYQTESLSSAEDLSRRSSETSDSFVDQLPSRGFVPYSNRSVSSRVVESSRSEEEDEVERYGRSAQGHYIQGLKPYVSAFTPPPGRSKSMSLSLFTPSPSFKTPSPVSVRVISPSPPPHQHQPSSLLSTNPRRSVGSLELYQSALGRKMSEPSLRRGSPLAVQQSYDTIIVSSIYQLSLKLKTTTDRTLDKLKEDDRVDEKGMCSPLDDLESQSATSEIPAYKSANQELASVLKNLRKLEQHIKVMNRVLFPDEDLSPDTSKEKHEYLQQIERIRNELAGFQPIETPHEEAWKAAETASVESDCEELGEPVDFY